MKLEQVRCFFQMLTQLEDVQPYEALISTAVTTVTDALKPNVDPTLQPLQLLAAAIANESYQILLATKEQTACTYAGTESANGSTLCTQTRPPTQSADYHGNLSAIWVFSV